MTDVPRLDATLCVANDDKRLAAQEAKQNARNARMTAKINEQGSDASESEDENDNDVDERVPDWESGDCGGFECYISADTNEDGEGLEASEVFKKDGEEEEDSTLLSVSPGFNVLSLVMRDKGLMRFVKYVNATAPGSRWDVTTEYAVVQDADSDTDDDDSEDEETEEGDEQ
jgi:hypothetical protein